MRNLLIILYLLILAIPLFTWWQGADLSKNLPYEMLRFGGLVTFTLMFLQLVIGGFMNKLRPIVGYKLLNFHIAQGLVAFVLVWLHPIGLGMLIGWERIMRLSGNAALGRIALFLLVVSTLAGLFRSMPFIQKYWRWIHRLNYVTFALVYWHAWNLGSDTRVFPMVIIFYLAPISLVAVIGYKLTPFISRIFKGQTVDGR